MDNERDAQEVMGVDAFSQLPFIRSAPAPKAKNSSGVRLFGIEFPNETERREDSFTSSACSKQNNNDDNNNNNAGDCGNNNNAGDCGNNNRKFECYYCCRIFPTSQALGGHQNAHKRERQQAKRAHFQSGAIAPRYHHHGGSPDGLYALLNYHNFNPLPTRLGFGHYPSWNGAATTAVPSLAAYPAPRLYGDVPGPMSHPIDGSPVSGPCRSPHVGRHGWGNVVGPVKLPEHHSNSAALPLLGDDSRIVGVVGRVYGHGGTCTSSSSSSSSSSSPPLSSQNTLVYESKPAGVEKHVSLDLNL